MAIVSILIFMGLLKIGTLFCILQQKNIIGKK